MSDLLLETERLFLRPPAAEDAPAHSEMMADPLTAQFLTFDGKPQDRVIAWRTWATLSGHWNFRGFGFFSMIDKETGRWAGRAGPWFPEGWPQIEIGWGVHPDFRGRGLALEAAIATAGWTFRTQGLDEIISLIRPENAQSRRVAEKFGEKHIRTTLLVGKTAEIWSLTKADYDRLWGDRL